jgi:hypothetical protein
MVTPETWPIVRNMSSPTHRPFCLASNINFQILCTGESFGTPPERLHDVISQMPRGR